ncbi:MAG: glycosyltransferase [Chitinophagaceae bacterium]
MKFTGERFVPIPSLLDDEIAFEHFHRYHAVKGISAGKTVLDIACGEGYGSSIMAGVAREVIGVDIDPESVDYAIKTYGSASNLKFIAGNATAIPLGNASVDMVVSFETIEHLNESDQELFLKEIKRVLRPDGALIMSTPDRIQYSDRYNYKNEFHLKEFSRPEYEEFLLQYFGTVSLYLQGYEVISAITPTDPQLIDEVAVCDWQREEYRPFARKYIIAVCTDAEAFASKLSSVVFQVNKDFMEMTDRIVEKEEEISKLGKWGQELDKIVAEQNKKLGDFNAELETISGLKQELEQQKLQIESMRGLQLKFEQQKIQAVQLKEVLEAERMEKKQLMLNIGELNQQVQAYYIRTEKAEGRLSEIYSSEGWKLLKVYYTLKGKFLNENSGHYKILRKVINKVRGKQTHPAHPVFNSTTVIEGTAPSEEFEPFSLPYFEEPEVTIIIPVFNGWQLTYRCLRSIRDNTLGVSYQVVLADDGSTDGTLNAAEMISNLKVIRNETNLGFLRNCNNAASQVKGEYIHFLNNDTQVWPNWLSSLVNLMKADEKIGLAGSKLIYPDGTLQEAGGIIWKDASGWNYGNRQDPDAPEYNYLKDADYISGASILVRTSIWETVGGFDVRYAPAYSEDSDLAFEVRKHGYRVVYQPLSEVIHFEGSSHGSERSRQLQDVNNAKFRDKWKEVLERDQFPNGRDVFHARDRSAGRKTMLIIDHYVPQFDKDAGSKTVFQYLKLFAGLGFNVKFLGDNFCRLEPYTTILQQLGIEVLYGEHVSRNWRKWIIDNKENLDYIWLHRPHISIKYIDFIRKNTGIKVLYYGHDLHFMREMRQYELEKKPAQLKSSEKWKETELYLFRNSAAIFTPSTDEKEVVDGLNVVNPVYAIKPYIFDHRATPGTDFSERKDILFVGGFGHGPNADAVKWFVSDIWPDVRNQLPGVKFIVAGSNPPQDLLDLAGPDIIIKGFVTEEELARLYGMARVAVVPLRYGAGVKGKTVEALYNGIPFVSTGTGLEGLPNAEGLFEAADTAEEFGRQLVTLYKSGNEALQGVSKKECDYLNRHFYVDVVKQEMEGILELIG